MNSFEARLAAALGKEQAGKVCLAAVSGGADSTAMLAGLAALRKEVPFNLYCVHVEHAIRPAEESLGDARAVEILCKKLDVPCRVIHIPPGQIASYAYNGGPGIEGAARFFRHKALAAEGRRVKTDWILTAHTKDDLLETILMRFLRGSGPAGLAPMPSVKGRLLRPLLDFTRQDVLKYLEEKEIHYRTDSTNSDIRFLRNRIRHKFVPFLDSFFPSWRNSLLTLAATQALTAEFLSDEIKKRLHWERAAGELRLREADFLGAPPILREEAIFTGADIIAASRKNQQPRRAAVRRVLERGTAGDLGPVRLKRQNGFICLKAAAWRQGERGFSLLINEGGLYTLKGRVWGRGKPDLFIRADFPVKGLPDGELHSRANPHAVFYSRFPLIFRNHRYGDRIYLGGQKRRFFDILDSSASSRYTGIITVCDTAGLAAFIAIGEGLTVIHREDRIGASGLSFFEVSLKRLISET
jgi:tRNA(Ile)-lysidine synthase